MTKERRFQELRGAGAAVVYDFQFDDSGNVVPDAELSAPRWLVRLHGENSFGTVVAINLHNSRGR